METRERRETVSYVLDNFSHLLTDDERAAVECVTFTMGGDTRTYAVMRSGGEASGHILALLANGQQALRFACADKLLVLHKELIFANACPSCGKLLRTPRARQCLKCGHSWHQSTAA
ncbi:hypothetical protein INH39_23830 [Massilia violaceinigra]|uniref:Zinc ribbon domain-containing protein n=1 Tax=Massilia violaceinigra TaxID=2045208 RepID=A0ABY4A124_9BURK|nr:hypothetical protein [Massilia violaceinigra]UOD28459.1 hypothetical protein INH39_23830 [Massilia violaceinigra]